MRARSLGWLLLGAGLAMSLAACIGWPSLVQVSALGPQRTLVILAQHDSDGPVLSNPEVYAEAFADASDWFYQASFGQTWLEGIEPGSPPLIVGPIELPGTTAECENFMFLTREASRLLRQPEVQAAVGKDSGVIDRIVIIPGGVKCRGAGGLGGDTRTMQILSDGYKASVAYVKPTNGWSTVAHEITHGFSLGHAAGWDCRDSLDDLEGCRAVEVGGGHPINLMGSPSFNGHLDVVQMEHIGWLSCEEVAQGSFRLDALELGATPNPRCLKVQVEGGWIFVEHRSSHGLDDVELGFGNFSVAPTFFYGVLLYYQSGDVGDVRNQPRSFLLSAAQFPPQNRCVEDESWSQCASPQAALLQGQTFEHPDGTRITLKHHGVFSSRVAVEKP